MTFLLHLTKCLYLMGQRADVVNLTKTVLNACPLQVRIFYLFCIFCTALTILLVIHELKEKQVNGQRV